MARALWVVEYRNYADVWVPNPGRVHDNRSDAEDERDMAADRNGLTTAYRVVRYVPAEEES